MVELETKLLPLTVKVNAGPPAVAADGDRELTNGNGLGALLSVGGPPSLEALSDGEPPSDGEVLSDGEVPSDGEVLSDGGAPSDGGALSDGPDEGPGGALQ